MRTHFAMRFACAVLVALFALSDAVGRSADAPRQPVRVGVVLDFSGKREATTSVMNGIRFAERELKQLGYHLQIETHDSGTDVSGTLSAMIKMLENPPDLIIAEVYSSKAQIAAELAEKAKRVMITPYATAPVVTKGRRYVFRAGFTDEALASRLATFARIDLQVKNAAIVTDAAQVYSQEFSAIFKRQFIAKGGIISAHEKILDSMTSFTDVIVRIAASSPDVVFLPLYDTTAARFISQARRLGQKSFSFLGGDGWGATKTFLDLVVERGSGLEAYWASHTPEEPTHPSWRDFAQSYKLFTGEDPGQGASLGYDSLKLLVAALKKVGFSRDQDKLADALRSLRAFQGSNGRIDFRGHQDPEKSIYVVHVVDGVVRTFSELKP